MFSFLYLQKKGISLKIGIILIQLYSTRYALLHLFVLIIFSLFRAIPIKSKGWYRFRKRMRATEAVRCLLLFWCIGQCQGNLCTSVMYCTSLTKINVQEQNW